LRHPLKTRTKPRAKSRTKSAGDQPLALSISPIIKVFGQQGRSAMVLFVISVGFAGLLLRAFWIQIATNDFYAEQGRKRYQVSLELPAARGRILDTHGRLLATSLPANAVWAIPEDIPDDLPPLQFAALANLLEIAEPRLRERLSADANFVYLKRQLDPRLAARILALKIDGIHTLAESKRFYPDAEVAAHLVGFTDLEDRGQEGLELAYQQSLAGTPGRRQVIRDRLGRVVDDAGVLRLARDGADVRLTIDSRLQDLAFAAVRRGVAEHQASAGAAVVLDARNGAILAIANWPSYDPNQRAGRSGATLRNRAFTDSFEPGSIIKPINLALALEQGRVTPESRVETAPGWLRMNRHTIRDTSNHGNLSVAEIIKVSSNIGMMKVMAEVPAHDMWEMFHSVGLGRPPGLAFPGLSAGRIRPYRGWRPIEQATMTYGYGLSVSLLQAAQAYTIFAGDGEFMPAWIIEDKARRPGLPVISATTALAVRDMLELAAGPGGTAARGRVPGYRVGAKTGTARKQEGRGYAARKYRAVFIGMAPLSAPRVIVAVMVDEPTGRSRYGGTVAGPVFAEITGGALRLLNVAPDA
jgi:cell division protein FtsI (penicillin-binding protein 3)